jgi:hypothetical protein
MAGLNLSGGDQLLHLLFHILNLLTRS